MSTYSPSANRRRGVKALWRQRWLAWLNRRIPPTREVTLNQKRVFIFPSWMGLGYLVTALLLFVAGINYENSLILNFSFLLGSLFIVAILQTFSNLSGLTITAGHTESAFAGSESRFTIHFSKSGKKSHHSIQCQWEGYKTEPQNLVSEEKVSVELLLPTGRRGRFKPGRLKLETVYPLGLCRSWTWIDLDMWCWVYPKPITCELPASGSVSKSEGDSVTTEGNEDFDGLRSFRESDSLRMVDWKSYARTGSLFTKQFHGYQSKSLWIDWENVPGGNLELKLSHMCFLVLEYAKTDIAFGLRLGNLEIEPGTGKQHELACLDALARY